MVGLVAVPGIPTWHQSLPSLVACLDATFRILGGVPSYVLTDNARTVTIDHVAGVPVRHPDLVTVARHYPHDGPYVRAL